MKRISIAFLFILFSVISQAQVSVGLRAGITRSTMVSGFADLAGTDALTGFTGGVYLKAKLLGIFVMPEVMYTQRGGTLSGLGSNQINYVDGTVLIGKQFIKFFRVNAGPVFQYAVGSSRLSQDAAIPNESEINDYALGLQAGVGVDLSKFSLDVRYDFGLTESAKVVAGATSPGVKSNYSTRNNMWMVTVGYRLWKL